MMQEELQLFLEDMDEQLSIMELTLLDILEIPIADVDSEMINKLFRAMHTMKGNAGMFNYSTIVSFAHEAENLLDKIRHDEIELTQEMLDAFLLVNDHSKLLIDVFTNGKELDEDQSKQHEYLLEQISSFLGLNKKLDNNEPLDTSSSTTTNETSVLNYTIDIKIKSDFFKSGMDMISIIKYLDTIGKIKNMLFVYDDIPSIEMIEPLSSYIKLDIDYETDEPLSEIIEAFEFVQEDVELKVEEKKIEEKDTHDGKNFVVFKKTKNKNKVKKEKEITNAFTLKVDSQKVDTLINQISEMVIANAKIVKYSEDTKDNAFKEAVVVMSTMLEEIRNGIMNIRMVQVGESFSKLRRIVADTAKETGKDIGFEIIGGETELDKTVIEKISDPLIHMLRNSVDHGIEMPEIRKENDKGTKGNITLKAFPNAGTIVIQIIDDGAGIDKVALYNKAVEAGIIKNNDKLSDSEIYRLIFEPGLSTSKSITNISGRGVGMDVVKKNIEELRGTVEVDSFLGKGTTITITLPLTLAIIDGFLVQSGSSKYIIPISSIKECIELSKEDKKQIKKDGYISLRSNILPILDVAEYFGDFEVSTTRENIVVVTYGNSQVGLKVDELYGEFQTVIKPLGDVFDNVSGISGGTILGDGEIALIFDVQKLIENKIQQKDVKDGN
ncbi:chemotaxis protein CheA [Sulfurimonas sp.]